MCVWVSRGDHSFHQVLRGPDTQGHRMVARMACHTHLIPAIQGLLHQSPKSRTLDLAQDASVCLPSSPGTPFPTVPSWVKAQVQSLPRGHSPLLTIPFSGHTPRLPLTGSLNHHKMHRNIDPTWGHSEYFVHDSPADRPPLLPPAGRTGRSAGGSCPGEARLRRCSGASFLGGPLMSTWIWGSQRQGRWGGDFGKAWRALCPSAEARPGGGSGPRPL